MRNPRRDAARSRADIDLEGDTRWVAAWLMAGRTLSLAFSLALLVRSVNVAGAVLVARTMH